MSAEVPQILNQAGRQPVAGGGSSGGAPGGRCRPHPLGPRWSVAPLSHPLTGRLYALAVLAGAAALLLVAARINPAGARQGTHRQLHLPPCGFALTTGYPCPTCGMTTAFAYTVHGQWRQAIRAQLAGFVLALGTVLAGLLAGFSAISGRRLAVNWYRLNPLNVLWWSLALLLAAWGLKIMLGLLEGSIPGGP